MLSQTFLIRHLHKLTASRLGLLAFFASILTSKILVCSMGLIISRSLIEANGGRLWVDPEKLGATFHMTLPFAP